MKSYMNHKLLPPTEENIITAETLRYNTYNSEVPTNILDDYYSKSIQKGTMLLFGTYIGEELCAACYVSVVGYSIFIDQLFVKKEYQNTGLRIGRQLLEYINFNKQIVQEHLQCRSLQTSKLIYTSEKSKSLYLKIGYKETNKPLNIMSKHI